MLTPGYARIVTHLPSKLGQGQITTETRQALGHANGNEKPSEVYVADPTRQWNNDRAENEWVDRFGPKFSSTSA